MGLDSYLYAQYHVNPLNINPDFDPSNPESNYIISGVSDEAKPILNALKLNEDIVDQNFSFIEVKIPIGYWRKCNHIHAWFIRNEPKDDCNPVYVYQEDLEKLKEICEKIKENHALAQTLLPTKAGFFFGSVDYDEDYFETLDYTIEILKRCRSISSEYFIYQASW